MGIGPKFKAAIERRKKSDLKSLTQAFSTPERQIASSARVSKGTDPAAAIKATQKAVSSISKAQGVSVDEAVKILRTTSQNIRTTRAGLAGISSGIEKRLASGKTGSFEISRASLARKLGTLQKDRDIVQHVINMEIAKPETLLNIDNTRKGLAKKRRGLLNLRR